MVAADRSQNSILLLRHMLSGNRFRPFSTLLLSADGSFSAQCHAAHRLAKESLGHFVLLAQKAAHRGNFVMQIDMKLNNLPMYTRNELCSRTAFWFGHMQRCTVPV